MRAAEKKVIYGGLLAAAVILAGCEIREPLRTDSQGPLISDASLPDTVYLGQPGFSTVSVTAAVPADPRQVLTVHLGITAADGGGPGYAGLLADDGRGRDVIAADGIYTAEISSMLPVNSAGVFCGHVYAADSRGGTSDTLTFTFEALNRAAAQPPFIFGPVSPDTAGSAELQNFRLGVKVSDPDGSADIDSVWCDIYQFFGSRKVYHARLTDSGADGDAAAGDSLYSFAADISNDLNSGGEYRIRFQAVDKNGLYSNAIVKNLPVILPDGPPVLSSLTAPDTVSRIEGAPFVISVKAEDPMGPDDIKYVYFNVTLPGGSSAAGNPFYMFDDGLEGDEEANDGIFSLTNIININNDTGDYRFVFQAEDRSGAISDPLTHIIMVVN